MLEKILLIYQSRSEWLEEYGSKGYSNAHIRFLDEVEDIKQIGCIVSKKFIVEVRDISKRNLRDIWSMDHEKMLIWNITDGCFPFLGSYLPGYCELFGAKFFGSSSYTQMLCQHKHHAKAIVRKNGINTPDWLVFRSVPSVELIQQFLKGRVAFVKPACLDNGAGDQEISPIVSNAQEVIQGIGTLLNEHIKEVIVETFLPGTEYTMPAMFLGKWELVPLKVHYSGNHFSSSEKDSRIGKYIPVSDIDNSFKDLIEMGLSIIEAIGIKDYCRIDFRKDAQGAIHFLEINSCPFLSSRAWDEFSQKLGIHLEDALEKCMNQSFQRQISGQ